MKVLITGADGLLARHLRAYLLAKKEYEFISLNREQFQNKALLNKALHECSHVIHFAGVNRGDDQFVYQGNIEITQALVAALIEAGSKAHIVFANSIHIDRNTAYGRAKKESAALLSQWAQDHGGLFTDLVLPNVFGEGGRQFYNSVVSTFCYQLAQAQDLKIINDIQVEQIHCSEVSEAIIRMIKESAHGQIRLRGQQMMVGELKSTLEDMAKAYLGGVIPALKDQFHLHLFNTFRSYLYPEKSPTFLEKKSDSRGWLVEVVKSNNGGQGFFSTTAQGITRGNHWHLHKIERFCVIKGQARIRLRHVLSNEIRDFYVSSEKPCFIDIPTLHTHNITNVGETELLTFFWSHEIFNSERPDTYSMNVEERNQG